MKQFSKCIVTITPLLTDITEEWHGFTNHDSLLRIVTFKRRESPILFSHTVKYLSISRQCCQFKLVNLPEFRIISWKPRFKSVDTESVRR